MLSPRRRSVAQTSIHFDRDQASPSKDETIELQRIDSHLPTFEESEVHEIVLRRQKSRLAASGVKTFTAPSRFSTSQLSSVWEFTGWGRTSTLVLTENDLQSAKARLDAERVKHVELGHFAAASIPAMGVLGSVFYSLPAVVAVCGMLSPVSLLIATLLLFFIRPLMEELASALPVHGSAYVYLLNTTSKALALVGAALQVLDYAMNSLQASASASAYVAGEATLPFPQYLLAGLFLIAFAVIGCLGAKESASFTLVIAVFHLLTMAALMIMSIVAWARRGNEVISANWHSNLDGASSSTIARWLFNGVCLGLLAISGFECSPEYAPVTRQFPKVLRNLHWSAIVLIAPLMLFVLALLPIDQVLAGYNVLSLLAESVAGKWMRYWVLVDAMIDGVLPSFLLSKLPITHAPWAIQAVFTLLCIAIYASTGASVAIIGKIFTISLLCVLGLFPIANILLKFDRGRLPRERKASLALVLLCSAVLLVAFAGNVALDPTTLAYFAPYAVGITAVLLFSKHSLALLRCAYWAYDSSDLWRRGRWTRGLGPRMITWMRRLRRSPVVCFVKTDEINALIRFVLYVQQNEPTSHLKFVHVFGSTDKVPCDFEAFSQILDEAFPAITIDMCFVHGTFDAIHVEAIRHKLLVPHSSVFIASFGKPSFPLSLKESGVRIVCL